MAVTDLPMPVRRPDAGSPARAGAAPLRLTLDVGGRRYALWVFDVGLACCAVEFAAASAGGLGEAADARADGETAPADVPADVDVMVVSGTVTDKIAPAVRRLYDELPDPKYVISFGACANSGGPYWDSYCVTKGVDQLIPVDVYVPGCPPRPEALRYGIARLEERIAAGGPDREAVDER